MGIYLLPHTLPHISSECVVFQSSEVFPTRHVCVVRGCYISAETSLAGEAELLFDNYSCLSAAEMFTTLQMDATSDFIGARRYLV